MIGNLGYQSGWTDPVTSNVNMGSRWYNPATGQFLSRDSASNSAMPNSAAANTFAYGDDNPLTAYDPAGTCNWWDVVCGAQQVASNVGNAIHTVASNVGSAISNLGSSVSQSWNNLTSSFNSFMAQAWNGLTKAGHRGRAHRQHRCPEGSGRPEHHLARRHPDLQQRRAPRPRRSSRATYHAVKYVASQAVQYVQHHAAAIVSFVASTAVFMGCEAAVTALSAGTASLPGEVGCSALAGAVGNVVTYAMTTPTSKWSLGGFAGTALQGAAVGAASGFLGSLGSELLGPVVDAIASRLGPAVVDDAARPPTTPPSPRWTARPQMRARPRTRARRDATATSDAEHVGAEHRASRSPLPRMRPRPAR